MCLHPREGLIEGFTSRYGVARLVRFEMFDDMTSAIVREKQLKKWNRDWKLSLIESDNPEWVDLAEGLGFAPAIRQRQSLWIPASAGMTGKA